MIQEYLKEKLRVRESLELEFAVRFMGIDRKRCESTTEIPGIDYFRGPGYLVFGVQSRLNKLYEKYQAFVKGNVLTNPHYSTISELEELARQGMLIVGEVK